jgi:hypothetical protein
LYPEHLERGEEFLAKPSYKHQKKQREEAQRKKKEEKQQRKAERKAPPAPTPET